MWREGYVFLSDGLFKSSVQFVVYSLFICCDDQQCSRLRLLHWLGSQGEDDLKQRPSQITIDMQWEHKINPSFEWEVGGFLSLQYISFHSDWYHTFSSLFLYCQGFNKCLMTLLLVLLLFLPVHLSFLLAMMFPSSRTEFSDSYLNSIPASSHSWAGAMAKNMKKDHQWLLALLSKQHFLSASEF